MNDSRRTAAGSGKKSKDQAPSSPTVSGVPPASRPLEPFVLVRASAGTGKTHALSTRMIRILADGAEVDDIFAATFARKAAGEILTRVLDRLAAAADSEGHETQALATAIDRPAAKAAFFRDLLVRVTGQLDRLSVGTLDSFFVTCADAARFELGLPPGWSIGSQADLTVQRRRAIHRTIADAIADGGPSARAGNSTDSPALILANLMVQLSGGTTTTGLEEAIEGIVADLAEIHRDTEAEAWDWLTVPRPPSDDAITAARQTLALHEYSDKRFKSASDTTLEALASCDFQTLLSKGMIPKLLAGETRYYNKPIDPEVEAALRTIIDLAKTMILHRAKAQTRAIRDLLDHYGATSDRLLSSDGMVSFNDVTRLVATAAGDGTLDSARWRGIRFAKHLLLDEFQDTAPTQWRVLERLAEHAITASGSFFAVGDRKQAIYGWRGGEADLIDALPGFFAAGPRPLKSQVLSASYRSSPAVLEGVNRVFERISTAEPLADFGSVAADWSRHFPRHEAAAARQDLPGWVRLRTCRAAEEGEKAADVLLAAVALRAAALSRANPGSTVGVLVRTNKAAERVIAKLKADGVIASAEGGQPLADSPAVELLLSVLHLVDHPSDSIARFHVGTSPLAGALGLSATSSVEKDPPPEFVTVLDSLRRELIDSGYGPVLARLTETLAACGSQRDRRRLEQFIAAAREWDMQGGGSREGLSRTEPFVIHCRTVNVADPVLSPIRVMTIHKAKGLEFDLVVLTDLDRKLVPRPPRVVVDRSRPGSPAPLGSPLDPIRRVLVHVTKDCWPLLPDDWRELCEAASHPVIREAIATLYVGLTRAAQGLEILIQPASTKERNIPRTLAGVIRATLPETPDAPADSMLHAVGHRADPALDSLPNARSTTATTAAAPPVSDETSPDRLPRASGGIVLKSLPGGRRRRARPLRTPSSTEGSRTVTASSLLTPGTRAARSVGTLLHAWIEQWGWPATAPEDAVLRRLASREPLLASQVDSLLADFRRMCGERRVAALLAEPPQELPARFVSPNHPVLHPANLPAGPAVPQLQRECAFALDDGQGTLLGVMDRLVVWTRDGKAVAAEVIDFKFDGMGTAEGADEQRKILAAKTAFYTPQLQAYRTAVATLHDLPLARVSCELVFMRSGDVVPVGEK
ncbi:MAG: hypothetical protein DWH79_00575 [Planctomycetota bacterium]|nr:MAG: hypothetical protein DWH79_00575 [Planctomycetota bacterium]